jgi:hypothetical protein
MNNTSYLGSQRLYGVIDGLLLHGEWVLRRYQWPWVMNLLVWVIGRDTTGWARMSTSKA